MQGGRFWHRVAGWTDDIGNRPGPSLTARPPLTFTVGVSHRRRTGQHPESEETRPCQPCKRSASTSTAAPKRWSSSNSRCRPRAPGGALVMRGASGVNFIDIYQRSGAYKLPLPLGLGLEGAGTVQEVGAG